MLSSDLPEADGPPRRFELLGEQFVAFRDTNGVVGVLDELCMHRGASLALGRVEECGIRCLYHGWKYSAEGEILETPNVSNPRYRERFRAPAYPVHEAGELIWVYFGPVDKMPPKPNFRFLGIDPDHRVVCATVQRANYLQVLEGLVDTSHVGILHADVMGAGSDSGHFDASTATRFASVKSPRLELTNTEFGFCSAAIRELPGEDGTTDFTRVTSYMSPIFAVIPPDAIFAAAVPINDEKTLFVNVYIDEDKPINTEPLRTRTLEYFGVTEEIKVRMGLTYETSDLPTSANRDNYFLQDRAAMKAGKTYTGVPNFVPEDAVVCMSMGPLFDRTREHLVPADAAVIRLRRLLARCVAQIEKGEDPIGVGVDLSGIRSPQKELASSENWHDLVNLSGGDAW